MTSPSFSVSSAFTITAVIKGNANNDNPVVTSNLTFTLVDSNGNLVATGYADGSTSAAIVPIHGVDTTYTISFTLEAGKSWSDVAKLSVSFVKETANIGLKSLTFNQ